MVLCKMFTKKGLNLAWFDQTMVRLSTGKRQDLDFHTEYTMQLYNKFYYNMENISFPLLQKYPRQFMIPKMNVKMLGYCTELADITSTSRA